MDRSIDRPIDDSRTSHQSVRSSVLDRRVLSCEWEDFDPQRLISTHPGYQHIIELWFIIHYSSVCKQVAPDVRMIIRKMREWDSFERG